MFPLIHMRNFLLVILFVVPFLASAQFGLKEMYGFTRFKVNVGMRDVLYATEVNGTTGETPFVMPLQLGNGVTFEGGLGFMIVKHFFVESALSYTFLHDKINHNPESDYYISDYRFNKTTLGANGIYFLDISPHFNLDLFMGLGLRVPQDLVVNTSQGTEKVKFNTTVTYQGGFGGSYIHNNWVFGAGLTYHFETYKMSYFQDIPDNFFEINFESDIDNFKMAGADITFSCRYLF